ncbi:MAG TPA: hypothetical protein VGB02_18510 [Pyrinomonadaceae bacterium]|jgi:hypothetical protein
MAVPMIKKEIRKPQVRETHCITAHPSQKTGVRPEVAKLISRVVKENAPTWEALAKR